jgi:PAS domain S-box-containing protein
MKTESVKRAFTVRGTTILADDRELLARVMLDAMSELVGVLDPSGTLLDVNRAALDGGGLAREDVTGKRFWETPFWTVSQKTQNDLYDAIQRAAAGELVRYDVEVFARNGGREIMLADFSLLPVRDDEGRVVLLLWEARELTERKGLERVVAQAMRDEAHWQRNAAEDASRARDEFLVKLGHELRNPLAPILTALELLKVQDNQGSERARTVIERQVHHLVRLVDDLLDVTRIVRGAVELKPELVEMAEIVARGVEMASPLLEQRTQALSVNVPRSGLRLQGDPTRLAQVVSNLLTNSAKYTPSGGTIDVRAEALGREIVLSVRDSGIGIAPDVLPRVFDLFVQERHADKPAPGGLGIGLNIVRSLVERHGGSVSAHSDGPGRGSEFIVRLPAVRSTSRPRHSYEKQNDSEYPPSGAQRILVVDDNEEAAQTLAEALRLKGYDPRVARESAGALAIAAEFMPDIAFLELGLPDIDGYELAELLRRIPGLSSIALIAVTASGQSADRERTRAAGFAHHLVKPVDIDSAEVAVRPRSA